MKKLILLIVLLICLTLTAFTAEDVFEEGSTGHWYYNEETDPIDDTTMIWFMLQHVGAPSRSPTLYIRYKDEKVRLYINWYDYFSDGSTRVTCRLDKEKAEKRSWTISTSNTATFYSTKSETTIKFIQKLMEADTLAVQATPYGEGPTTVVFDVRGLRNAIEQFNDILHWIKD